VAAAAVTWVYNIVDSGEMKKYVGAFLAGVGSTLIVDKLWWLKFAEAYNFPDHYTLGSILIIVGIILLRVVK
jgi:hypothetical protein